MTRATLRLGSSFSLPWWDAYAASAVAQALASGLGAVHPTLEDPCRTSPSNQRQRVLIGHDRADTFTSRRLAMRSSVKAYNHCPKLPLAYDCIASHDIGPCPMSSL